jgi:hypothetical protein
VRGPAVALDAGKTVESITLPAVANHVGDTAMHVYAVATG